MLRPFSAVIIWLTAVLPVAAADLGGNCCADLEERIAELEITTARKGNKKVTLTINQLYFGAGSYNFAFDSFFGLVETEGQAFVRTSSQIAVIDTTGFALADRAAIDLTSGIVNVLSGALDGGLPAATQGFLAPSGLGGMSGSESVDPATSTRPSVWASALGRVSNLDANGPSFEADQSLAGGLGGAQFNVNHDLTFGAFAGGARSSLDAEFDAQRLDADFALGGFYGRWLADGAVIDFSITGAWTSTESRREIATIVAPGSFEIASADYSGWLLSPAISIGVPIETAPGTIITPAIKARFLHQHFDSYTETGSTANLSVGGRDLSVAEGRLELGLQSAVAGLPNSATVRGKAGLLALGRFGDDSVDAVLLGTALNFQPGTENREFGAYVGAGLDLQLDSGISLFGDSEVTFSGEAQSISGYGGVRVPF